MEDCGPTARTERERCSSACVSYSHELGAVTRDRDGLADRPAQPIAGRFDLLPSYGVNSTNIRIVSSFKPSSRIAFLPSSDRSNS